MVARQQRNLWWVIAASGVACGLLGFYWQASPIRDARAAVLPVAQWAGLLAVQVPDDVLLSTTTGHDGMVNIPGYGDVVEVTETNALGHLIRKRIDGAGRVIQSIDAEGHVTNFSYDANGNLKTVRDPNGVGYDYQYDALNRRIAATDTAGHTTTMQYDSAGNLVAEVDAKGQTTTHRYDGRGRRISTTDRLGNTTQWQYDAAGNELAMTDAQSQTTSYVYDVTGRKVQTVWPDHVAGMAPGDQGYGIVTITRDAVGRVKEQRDQRGTVITYLYDLAGRVVRREYRDLGKTPGDVPDDFDSFTYDAAGRVLTANKGRYANSLQFAYDAAGRKKSESLTVAGQTHSVGTDYDKAGRTKSLTYPDGTVVSQTHTPRGQLASVDRASPNEAVTSVANFHYDNGGREASRTYGNGVTTTRTYGADDSIESIATPGVESLSYTYDANRNPTSETRTGVMAAQSWSTGANGFDAENRLVSWSRTNGDSQSWTLSPVNDWDQFTSNGTTQTRTHGPAHELLTVDAAALQHDANGNLTRDERSCLLLYDADNMLREFQANGVANLSNATYLYDALGRRVAKTVAPPASDPNATPKTTIYILNGQQVVSEFSTSGPGLATLISRLIYGTYIDEPIVLLTTTNNQPTALYYHANRQFSSYALTDNSGSVSERFAYTPFGQHRAFADNGSDTGLVPQTANRTLFTGRLLDIESALHFFRSRFFRPLTGTFYTRDTLMYPDGSNTYAGWFAAGDLDPTGKITVRGIARGSTLDGISCGGRATAVWEFYLDENPPCEGFIVQKVDVVCQVSPCNREAPEDKFSYWEAWHVPANSTTASAFTDNFGFTATNNRWGSYDQTGTIRFYCKDKFRGRPGTGDLNKLWVKGGEWAKVPACKTTSISLPSTNQEPGFWSQSSIGSEGSRNAWVGWYCCPCPPDGIGTSAFFTMRPRPE